VVVVLFEILLVGIIVEFVVIVVNFVVGATDIGAINAGCIVLVVVVKPLLTGCTEIGSTKNP
jgi:hypothetical protein